MEPQIGIRGRGDTPLMVLSQLQAGFNGAPDWNPGKGNIPQQ